VCNSAGVIRCGEKRAKWPPPNPYTEIFEPGGDELPKRVTHNTKVRPSNADMERNGRKGRRTIRLREYLSREATSVSKQRMHNAKVRPSNADMERRHEVLFDDL